MQFMRLLTAIQVNKLQAVKLAELMHDFPVVVLGNKYLVQVDVLWSAHVSKSLLLRFEIDSLDPTTYRKLVILVKYN